MPGIETDICVVIPTIPPRVDLLCRALRSVSAQTWPPDAVSIAIDHARFGAACTRNRALAGARSEWVAFLDDDDILYPQHLMRLKEHQADTGADVIWGWFDVIGGTDPFPMHEGRQWNPDEPHAFPVTTLVRRSLAMDVGGFPEGHRESEVCAGEDFQFFLKLSAAGAVFAHIPERTWAYHHHGASTSGLPDRW